MSRHTAVVLIVYLNCSWLAPTAWSGQAEYKRCLAARDEFGGEWKPGRGPAEKAISACTAFIEGGGEREQLADAYIIRARGYAGLGLDHYPKGIADMKKAHELSPNFTTACGLARLGVSGYSCDGPNGGGLLPRMQ